VIWRGGSDFRRGRRIKARRVTGKLEEGIRGARGRTRSREGGKEEGGVSLGSRFMLAMEGRGGRRIKAVIEEP